MAIPAGMEYLGKSGYYLLVAYLILPILLMVTQFIMQKWMTPAPAGPESQAANMTRQVGLMMTFMFGFFTLQVPAGLTLYWVTSNLLQMLQQWAITSDRFNLSKVTIKESVLAPSSDDDEGDDVEDQPANNAAPATASQSAAKTRSSKSRRSKRK
jgi:YidC/Oxa1 family membrane protein insertase